MSSRRSPSNQGISSLTRARRARRAICGIDDHREGHEPESLPNIPLLDGQNRDKCNDRSEGCIEMNTPGAQQASGHSAGSRRGGGKAGTGF